MESPPGYRHRPKPSDIESYHKGKDDTSGNDKVHLNRGLPSCGFPGGDSLLFLQPHGQDNTLPPVGYQVSQGICAGREKEIWNGSIPRALAVYNCFMARTFSSALASWWIAGHGLSMHRDATWWDKGVRW